jgi:serine/threonine protein kinase
MASSEQQSYRVERFGPYEVHQRLGIGGMATVHLALERGVEGFERWVALKRLLPHLGADEEFVRAFVREAQLACRLSHPNIVRIFELGRVGEDYFISMEYIEGRDIRLLLRQARKVAGPPPLQVTMSLLSELLDALDYAHRKTDDKGRPLGLVHRDVSPSNLLVTTNGHLKIIDFGIAKASSEKQLTATGKIKGKIAYMAPEALRGRRRDARSDLFSVGVIAHELLTARPLFASKNDYKTIERIQHDDVVPPSAFNTNCPPQLDDFVLKALTKNPEDRYASARLMLEVLEELAQSLHLHATARDVGSWVEWAFSLPIPRRKPATEDSTLEIPGRKASHAEADDELLDIIWGSAGGPASPLKLDELTALLPLDADDAETDPIAAAPTAMLFAIGPDDEGWEQAVTIAKPERVGAEIESEFGGTEPGGLAGLAARVEGTSGGSVDVDVDDWRTEPSVDSLDLPSAMFSETKISALSQPLGGSGEKSKAPLPDLSAPRGDFDDTEPSEIGLPPMSLRQAEAVADGARVSSSPFDDSLGGDDPTRVDPDVLASSPKPEEEPEPETEPEPEPEPGAGGTVTAMSPPPPATHDDSEVILLQPKAKKRITDQTAVPPLPASGEPSVSVVPEEIDGAPAEVTVPERPSPIEVPAPRATPSSAPPPAIRRTVQVSSAPPPIVATPSDVPEPTGRESSAPAPIPVVSAIPAPAPGATPPVAEAPEYAPPEPQYAPPEEESPPAPPEPAPEPEPAPRAFELPERSGSAPPDDNASGANRALSIPPPPKVDSPLPAILIGLAAVAIVGSVVAFFLWPKRDKPAVTSPDAAVVDTGVRLSITTTPAASEISIDGVAVELPARLEPGRHRVEIAAPDRMTWIKDIELVDGEPLDLGVELAGADPESASLVFESPEGAAIFIDERPRSVRTPASIEVAPGPHAIVLRRGDQVVFETALEVRANTQYVFAPEVAIAAPPAVDAGATAAVDAAPAATERTGEPPRIRARDRDGAPASVDALVCIDRRGRVQSVRLETEVSARVNNRVVRAVEKWRYKPYLRDHKPVPACFDETIPIQIEK